MGIKGWLIVFFIGIWIGEYYLELMNFLCVGIIIIVIGFG